MNTPRRILLIETERDIAEMLRLLFEEHGYTLHHVTDGPAALQVIRQQMPHLVLMDLALPGTDGFAIAARLRALPRTRHIPLIIITRENSRANRQQAWELGVYDFVAKPFDPQELLLRVQNSVHSAEQASLIDVQSGLPGASVTRDYLATARSDPALAIIEVRLEHSAPYRDAYGEVALRRVAGYLGGLVVWALGQQDTAESFAGHLAEQELALVYPANEALACAERIVHIFNFTVPRYYNELDQARNYMEVSGERTPLMCIRCRVHWGERQVEVPADTVEPDPGIDGLDGPITSAPGPALAGQ
ncbi:MAG: response regulator [Anaerolineae bacterium]|nr:response regulator [Anaerolineae bacterium]